MYGLILNEVHWAFTQGLFIFKALIWIKRCLLAIQTREYALFHIATPVIEPVWQQRSFMHLDIRILYTFHPTTTPFSEYLAQLLNRCLTKKYLGLKLLSIKELIDSLLNNLRIKILAGEHIQIHGVVLFHKVSGDIGCLN